MRTKLTGRENDGHDDGFTLIELLIVIIIIGILAAIAIPVFLNQRQKAYDAAAKEDLRNLANFEEIYLNDFDKYGPANAVILAEPKMVHSEQIQLEVVGYTANGYCLKAAGPGSPPRIWYYDSLAGGMQKFGSTTCPTVNVTQAGVDGLTWNIGGPLIDPS